jgi:hypothetical protein
MRERFGFTAGREEAKSGAVGRGGVDGNAHEDALPGAVLLRIAVMV